MPSFTYKAKDRRGNEKTGTITAKNRSEAKKRLSGMRLHVVTLRAVGDGVDSGDEPIIGKYVYRDANGDIQIGFGERLPTTKDIIVFTKQFSTMLGSGVAMVQSIDILSKQQSSKDFARILMQIQRSVENGQTLSASLKEHPKTFDTLYTAMVSAGEASGNLDVILSKLVTYIEKAEKIKSQVKSALTYPILVLIIAVLVVSGLLIFVVPTFAQQYTDTGRELPGLTQVVIDLSNFVSQNWYLIFGGIIGFIIGLRLWIQTPRGRIMFDYLILKSPGIGALLKKIAVGRFCSTMSSMLGSGVNLLEALTICAASSGNKTIELFVLNVRSGLEKGQKFSEPLSQGGLFPEMVISMVIVGETTGSLDDMLTKVSEFYEEEVDLAVQTLLSMIEPIMIVVIGGIVAFIVVAMYLPVFDMAGGID